MAHWAASRRAAEFDQGTRRHDRLDFRAVKATRKNRAQQPAMLFQQLEREFIVALGQRAVAHHVGEHDGRELAFFGLLYRHRWIKSEPAEMTPPIGPISLFFPRRGACML